MARTPRVRNLPARQLRSTPCDVPSCFKTKRIAKPNEMQLASEKKDWKDATCPVCLEHPHDAVLLLCTSYDKGCRPYICGTNYHQSNCLELFKEAYKKEKSICDVPTVAVPGLPNKQPQAIELACPLCRGEVKGWTVVEPARRYLNCKRRTCMHDGCLFVGSYNELCKHVNSKHCSSKPREVDPVVADKWKQFENERERRDAISIIMALNPGSVIMGDYVVELNGSSDTNMYSDSDGFISDESTDFSTSSDDSLDEHVDVSSLHGTGRTFFSRDSNRRAHRRLGERPR